MGRPECHVVITELDDEIEVQHDECNVRRNVEEGVNIAGVEPQMDQPNATTVVEDEYASPGQYHDNIDFNWDEPIFNEFDEGDYNVDEPLVDEGDHNDLNWEEPVIGSEQPVDEANEQPVHEATEQIQCNWKEPVVDHVHSDYGLSDELESLNSDKDVDEPRRRVREPIFNAKTDMSDPWFALGMIFEIVQVLRTTLVEYSIKNGRPIHYVKNDATRVRTRCEDPCPWEIYAAV
ncbi:SWIM-type domain-containing protein [Abeliophyllum distichum]|uniref:SWIM-type domain-containing protein n=1 Tax=Abeliophyllum distichum TaxID=126358 RepID=A0ABD1U1R3_9LAMI